MQFEQGQVEMLFITTCCLSSEEVHALSFSADKEDRELLLRKILEADPAARGAWIDELDGA